MTKKRSGNDKKGAKNDTRLPRPSVDGLAMTVGLFFDGCDNQAFDVGGLRIEVEQLPMRGCILRR